MDLAATSPLKAIQSFKARRKFAASAWKKRGLLPSSAEVCEQLETFFNELAVELLIVLKADGSKSDLQQALVSKLQSLSSFDYDTEEREFICDEFARLGKAVGLGSPTELDDWLYGSDLAEGIEPDVGGEQELIVATHSQACTGFAAPLESRVSELRADIDFGSRFIVTCVACGEYNFLTVPAGISRFRNVGYEWVEQLWNDLYTEEAAKLRFQKVYEARRKRIEKKNARSG